MLVRFMPLNQSTMWASAARSAAMLFVLACVARHAAAHDVLVEAESFASPGGWSLDTQFIHTMGSPYLLAHGLGKPVAPASTTVRIPAAGTYHVFVRTMDWVAVWNAPGTPGKFQLAIGGKTLDQPFGVQGADWHWQAGGSIDLPAGDATFSLKDLTGFDGRCDAIYLSTSNSPPPNEPQLLAAWRLKQLKLPADPLVKAGYDLVVVGGGYGGMGSAISAARAGCKVALIQDRPVLGGNGSSEVRVWAMGHIRRGRFPRVGEIVEEFADKAKKSPGTFEEFGDAQKEALVRAEPNIDLYLNHHASAVELREGRIDSVTALDTRTSQRTVFRGMLFVDATGHGVIGQLAGADLEMTPKGRMGMSNMWAWGEGEQNVAFPETPWALDLTMKDFPYPVDHHGQWFWESGYDKDPIADAERIRDWNLRAVFGAFNAMKNRDGAAKHAAAFLTWIAYVGGPRESRRLMGDVVLTQDDIVAKKEFKDGCVPSTWSIDLHYPKQQFAKKFPDNPFISIAEHDFRIDRQYGYPVPYRCFYSRNIPNLFMAGRCISVTHEALGTVRVMKTCGMMGEVVGKAASICVGRNCSPRDVYEKYWPEMEELLKLPGQARRSKVSETFTMPANPLPLAGPNGPPTGLDPQSLPGIVVDDVAAVKTGKWTSGEGLKGYVGNSYLYAGPDSESTIRFTLKPPKAGLYDVRIAYQPHENRAKSAQVSIATMARKATATVDMRTAPPLENGFASVGRFQLDAGENVVVELTTAGAGGNVHADAVQLLPVDR